MNNILNNSEDIISDHQTFKSLNVITNLIVQAKFNSEQNNSFFKDQEKNCLSHRRTSTDDHQFQNLKQQRSRSLKSQHLKMSNIVNLVTSNDLGGYNEPTLKHSLNFNFDNMVDRYNDSLKESLINSNLTKNPEKTSDYDSGESPNSSDYNSDNDKLQGKVNGFLFVFPFNIFKVNNLISRNNTKTHMKIKWSKLRRSLIIKRYYHLDK